MREYLFSFEFEKNTQNSYMTQYLKEKELDFLYHYQELYADLFGTGTYYRLECEHVVGVSFDVFYEPEKTVNRERFQRKYPLKERVLRVHEPYRTVKVILENEDSFTTQICGNKDKILSYYLNKHFNVGTECDNIQKAVKVEFIA